MNLLSGSIKQRAEGMMTDRPHILRRNRFIKKGFQINFSIRFLMLIVIEAILLVGLFWYMSHNTLTTGYVGSQLRIENTSRFFLPSMMIANLIVVVIVGLTGLIGLIFISHKIAGPLYRFEDSLKEISGGDLTHRISTRKKDQLKDLSDSLNGFTAAMDEKVFRIKQSMQYSINEITELQNKISSDDKKYIEIEQLVQDLANRLNIMQSTLDGFKTSQDNDSKGLEA